MPSLAPLAAGVPTGTTGGLKPPPMVSTVTEGSSSVSCSSNLGGSVMSHGSGFFM